MKETMRCPHSRRKLSIPFAFGFALWLSGCAADPLVFPVNQTPTTDRSQQEELAKIMAAAGITFHQEDFFSMLEPRSDTSCAGDAKIYHDPLVNYSSPAGVRPSPLPTSVSDSTMTMQPAFIKNVSVDLTDSNTPLDTNLSRSCSLGVSSSVPPPSACATFDFPSAGGLMTNMGGSLLMIGGIYGQFQGMIDGKYLVTTCGRDHYDSGTGTAYTNSCPSSNFALAVDALPATAATDPANALVPGLTSATEPISTWVNLGSVTSTVPSGLAGATAAVSFDAKKALFFGGSNTSTGVGNNTASLLLGRVTADTWTLNLLDRTWSMQDGTTIGTVEPTMVKMLDNSTNTLEKKEGGRSLFGYVAMPGIALTQFTLAGTLPAYAVGPGGKDDYVDRTERVAVIGGISASGPLTDIHLFNPTYGPELMDATDKPAANTLAQWAESYHTRLITNGYDPTPSAGGPPFTAPPKANVKNQFPPYDYNLTTQANTHGGGPYPNTAPRDQAYAAIRNSAGTGASYLIGLGGFDPGQPTIIPSTASDGLGVQVCTATSSTDFARCGPLLWSARTGADTDTSAFVSIPNLPDTSGTRESPQVFTQVPDTGFKVAWYGAAQLLPGRASLNDLVFFGGTSCRDYLTDTLTSSCYFNNAGSEYTGLNTVPANTAGANLTQAALTGTVPVGAGMATARGLDETGTPILIAWGGVDSNGAASGAIHPATYSDLYYSCGNPSTQWYKKTGILGGPPSLVNSAMVFSHVTRKFYLFGGYNRNSSSNPFVTGDTWELSVSLNGNCAAPANVTVSWRQLTAQNGMTCYPSCPQVRHSHKIVEVDYYDRNIDAATGAYVDVLKGFTAAQTYCGKTSPCSFGIFMEGGTDGTTYLADRWMFDPTANPTDTGPMGQWIKMAEVPPRTLAAMTSFEYVPLGLTTKIRRTLMFGGETGLQSPSLAQDIPAGTPRYYVAPTLGDTLMFDFDKATWNRTQLLGKGYKAGVPAGLTEIEKRQAFTAGTVTTLTPPPLSGAIMITRTHKQDTAAGTITPLTVPEIFLFGGRQKDGSYHLLSNVYKFCPGSTGEWYNGAAIVDGGECDHFDAATNTDSPSPSSKYLGRWLKKSPVTPMPANSGPFMGAAAYDSSRDIIVLFGGRSGTSSTDVVTATPLADFDANGDPYIYEYTPPSSASPQGVWDRRATCTATAGTSPALRYGHTVAFDSTSRRLIVAGGFSVGNAANPVAAKQNADGTPLAQTVTYSGGTYTMPEVWTATRDDINDCYDWKQMTTFANLPTGTQAPPASGLGFSSGVFVPSQGFNSGFYTMMDFQCTNQGPIASTDSSINKLLAGGVSFDIDRSALGPNENLLLHITYLPLGEATHSPEGGYFTPEQSALFKIHLMKTGQSLDALRSVIQPRYLFYSSEDQFPHIVDTLTVLSPPADGMIRQEQIILPVSMDSEIDRIRVERYMGSGILLDAALFRMGYR